VGGGCGERRGGEVSGGWNLGEGDGGRDEMGEGGRKWGKGR